MGGGVIEVEVNPPIILSEEDIHMSSIQCMHYACLFTGCPSQVFSLCYALDPFIAVLVKVHLFPFVPVQMQSPLLINVIHNQCQLLEFTAAQLQLIECFLHPNLMVRSPETPLPRDANEEILELGADGQPRLKVKEVPSDQMEDPIYALFNPPKGSRDGEAVFILNLCAYTLQLWR